MDKFKLFVLSLTLVSLSLLTQGQAQNSFIIGSITTSGTTTDCSTAGTCIILAVQRNAGGASININGTFSGTLQFEAATDPAGQNYTAIAMTPLAGGTAVTSATAAGSWTTNASGIVGIRVRASALASGSAQVSIQQSTASASSRSSSSGGSGTGSGAAPVVGFYLSSNCPTANTGQCVNSPANTQIDNTTTWTTSNGNIVATDSPFKSSDVGKVAWGYGGIQSGCNPYQAQPVANAVTTTHVTISTFTDANHITVSATPSTVSAAQGLNCFIWGNPDDTAAATLWTQVNASNTCPKVTLAAGYYMFTTPPQIMWGNPVSCAALGYTYPNGATQANMLYAAGYDLEGRGVGTTTIFIPPDFPETGGCTHGRNSNACFAVPIEGMFSDFSITSGAGNGGMPNGKVLMNVDIGSLEHFTCAGVSDGSSFATSIGVQYTYWAQGQQVNTSSCGSVSQDWDATTGFYSFAFASCYRCESENAYVSDFQLESTAVATLFTSKSEAVQGTTAQHNVGYLNKGGTWIIEDGGCFSTTASSASPSCVTNSGAGATNHFIRFNGSGAQNNGGANGLVCTIACTDYLVDSTFAGNASGKNYTDVSGSVLYDLCGNAFNGATTSTVNGTVFGSCSATGTTQTAANITASTGWGTSGAAGNGVSAVSGNATRETFTITAAGSPTPSPTIAIVFPTTLLSGTSTGFLIAPSCMAQQIGGTGAVSALTQTTGPSATGVTLTWAGTPGAASTYIFTVVCQN